MEFLRKLCYTIVASVVTNEHAVSVDARTDDMGILLTVTVAKEDMGYVIGSGGATIKALRVLMKQAGMRHTANVSVQVPEPN